MPARTEVEAKPWSQFRPWFGSVWSPGEHIAVIAPTGAGKSTLVGGLLDLRRYVLVADPKGGDDIVNALGYRRLTKWPGERKMIEILNEDEKKGRPSRFIIGPVANRGDDLPKLRQAIEDSLDGVFDLGGFTYYIDELQVTADRRMMNLAGKVDKLLVAARGKAVSVVCSFQQPRWVTSASLTQPTWLFAGFTRDVDTIGRMAELLGRPRAEIRGAMAALGTVPYSWLVVGRDPRSPLMLTKPDKIAPKKAS